MHAFFNTKFQQTTESFQIRVDGTVKQMKESQKPWSEVRCTLCYLNRVKNALDQKSRILLINVSIFSNLNYCSSIWGKCSKKQNYEVQKCINFAAKVANNGKYLKRDNVTPILKDLKWINFNNILRLYEAFSL